MFKCQILADSINSKSIRLTTFEVTFPRIILAEVNTHRDFSRNSSSSRAIPIEKMIARIKDDPFIPSYWGQNQKGMSSSKEIENTERAEQVWLEARDLMIGKVNELIELKVHKEKANRLLEPWVWQTALISSTQWDNFFNLRIDEHAQPEIQTIASMMKQTLYNNVPAFLDKDEWHMPLLNDFNDLKKDFTLEQIRKICVGRCCRISYLTHDGVRNPEEDIRLCENLIENGHMSPFEHCAINCDNKRRYGNFSGFKQYRKFFRGEAVFQKKTNVSK